MIIIIIIVVVLTINHVVKYSFNDIYMENDEKINLNEVSIPIKHINDNNNYNDDKKRKKKKIPKIAIINRIQKILKNNSRIFPDCDNKEIDEFSNDFESFLYKNFEDWNENDDEHFRYYCDCGVKKLQNYGINKHKIDVNVATDIIYHIDEKILKHLDDNRAKNQSYYYNFAIYLTRLLLSYEFLADDGFMDNKLICHEVINKLTDVFNDELHSTDDWISLNPKKIVYLNIPRLLTNYLYDLNKFNEFIDNGIIDLIRKSFSQVNDRQYKYFYLDLFDALEMINY
ncbi:probable DNA repair protein RAD50 [Microplitis mediator]|uniref:probable DNA repair protein RAD50 n=1 Tax=Microplitis mediator TaxID=375433 RepID=UPI0025543072|nr:probable DNA repair protein RAD50 [Microplitis mediator]